MKKTKIDWTKVLTNLGGTGAGAGSILAFVPPEYQVPASIGLAILANIIGAVQGSVIVEDKRL